MNVSPLNRNQQTNFGASYRVYFKTSNNERIISEENMEKCLHYLEAHLNRSKRITKSKTLTLNQELIDTFCGKTLPNGTSRYGDADYCKVRKIRRVPNKTEENPGYVTIVTGKDVNSIDDNYGKDIGKARKNSNRILGKGQKSFELTNAVKTYKGGAARVAAEPMAMFYDGAIVRNGKSFLEVPSDIKERIYIDAIFDPVYFTKGKSKGQLKGFEFKNLGFYRMPTEPKEAV